MRIPSAIRVAAALCTVLAAGCVSNKTVESHQVTDTQMASGGHRAEVHTALAGEYFARGNYAIAGSETELAIKDDPAYVPAWNMRGLVKMELRDDTGAREAFDKAYSLAPKNPEVLNNFGWYLCTRGDTERGMSMLRQAAGDRLYPTPEKALLSAGLCLRRMHRDAEAEDYLRRAVTVRPDLLGALYNLAVIDYDRGAFKDAEGYLNRYMRLYMEPPLDGLVLGVRIARANNDSPSEQSYLQQLRRRFPDAPQTRELLGAAPKG